MKILKIVGKYIGIGMLVGIGFYSTEFFYVKQQFADYSTTLKYHAEYLKELNEESTILASELYSEYLPEQYYDPNNKLHFDLQSYTDKGERIQVSGIVSNQSDHVWKNIFLEFEATDGYNKLIGECQSTITNLAPGEWEGVVVECPKIEKFKASIIKSVRMSIKFNFRGKRVISHNK